jgi:hypothetical protein
MSKRAEEAAWAWAVKNKLDPYSMGRAFGEGYEQAEKDLGWHSVDECLPPIDEEVIVLTDEFNTAPIYKIGFGHIVDKNIAVDYNGWNTPGVKYWMPCPKIPEE